MTNSEKFKDHTADQDQTQTLAEQPLPAAWAIDPEKLTVLLAPQGTELPSGFPFPRVTADLRGALTAILDAEPGAIFVLAIPESAAETLISLRAGLDYNALSLVGGDIDPVGLWSLTVSPLQELAIQEIMKSRAAVPSFSQPPKGEVLKKEDIKTFSRDVAELSKRNTAWDKAHSSDDSVDEHE